MGDFVQINVSNSQNDTVSFEKKFPKNIKIGDLKVIFLKNYIKTSACCFIKEYLYRKYESSLQAVFFVLLPIHSFNDVNNCF